VQWTGENYTAPYSLIGDSSWSDYTVAADVLLEQSGQVELLGRAEAQGLNDNGLAAYHLFVSDTGAWSIQRSDIVPNGSDTKWSFSTLTSGTQPPLGIGTWHRLALGFQGDTVTAGLDGAVLGSATDSDYGSGLAGLGVGGYYGAQFANFSVTPGTVPTLSGTYQLKNVNSGQLMDTSQAQPADTTAVIQSPSDGGTDQQWTIAPVGDGYYSITSANPGPNNTVASLDIYAFSPTAGTPLQMYHASGGSNQEWSIAPTSGGAYAIEDRASGYVLGVSGGSTARGANVIQWPADNGTEQQWQLIKVG
jgi:Ricin-type beta-trefoil lectin domain-like